MSPDPRNRDTTSRKTCPLCGLEVDFAARTCPKDGTDLSSSILTASGMSQANMAALPKVDMAALANDPSFKGRYEFIDLIGSGGMGVIYKARQLALSKLMAIKMMHAHLMSEKAIARFQVEGQAASRLSNPYIVVIRDCGTTSGGQPYLVMDYVEGETLSQVVAREGPLVPRRFLRLFAQACEALAHAHSRSVLHRDIKPSNLMVVMNDDDEEEIRVMDFGIAKVITEVETGSQPATKTGDTLGSPLYMSPEAARGQKADTRSDIYSLGCVMYECLTGEPPFIGSSALDTMLMHLDVQPKRPSEMGAKSIDPRLEEVVMKLLSKKPEDRYQTMNEVRDALIAISVGKTAPIDKSRTKSKIPTLADKVRANKKLVIISSAAAVCATALGAGAWYYIQDTTDISEPPSAHTDAAIKATGTRISPVRSQTTTTASADGQGSADGSTPANGPSGDSVKTATTSTDDQSDVLAITSLANDGMQLIKPILDQPAKDAILMQLKRRGDISISKLNLVKTVNKEALSPFLTEDTSHVWSINAKDCGLHDADLENFRNLKKICILDLSSNDVADLHALKALKTLTVLNLAATKINSAGLQVIRDLPNLSTVALGKTLITDSMLRELYPASQLRTLELYDCPRLTVKGIRQLEDNLPSLHVRYFDPKKQVSESANRLLSSSAALVAKREYQLADHEFDEAVKAVKAMPKVPFDALAELLQTQAEASMAEHRNEAAIKYLTEAATLLEQTNPNAPHLANIYCMIHYLADGMGGKKVAIAASEKAARVWERMRQPTRTRTQQAQFDQQVADNWRDIGNARMALDNKDKEGKAREAFLRAIREYQSRHVSSEGPIDCYMNLGYLDIVQGKWQEAIQFFNTSEALAKQQKALNPGRKHALDWARGWTYWSKHQWEPSIPFLKASVANCPDKSVKALELGVLIQSLNQTGRKAEAEQLKPLFETLQAYAQRQKRLEKAKPATR